MHQRVVDDVRLDVAQLGHVRGLAAHKRAFAARVVVEQRQQKVLSATHRAGF
jgi:hypothetical protein